MYLVNHIRDNAKSSDDEQRAIINISNSNLDISLQKDFCG